MENREDFSFTYSAARQQEIENIRRKYLPREEDKMDRLRKLHNGATQKARARSIALGIIGALILGVGMSLIMTDLGQILGLYGVMPMLAGVVTGVAGLILVALAYPVYNRVLKKERQRIAPEILRLADELMK